jgi:L-amino acid N-acyltransferase YncA
MRNDIRVRRVDSADAIELERFYAELSDESRVARFHAASRGISQEQATEFASADHRRRDGFVAVADGRIVGHLMLEPMSARTDELAVAVKDGFQHHGVGTLLMAAAVASARLRGVRRIVALVKPDNSAMQQLLTSSPHALRRAWEGSVARYELEMPRSISGRVAP